MSNLAIKDLADPRPLDVTDARIAALAIEHGCELASPDSDFSRFPNLKWRNPLR